jgi:hypothetical protein
MANIFLNLPKQEQSIGCRFRVEWDDNGGRTRERYFASYKAAETFAHETEVTLFDEALKDFLRAPRDDL